MRSPTCGFTVTGPGLTSSTYTSVTTPSSAITGPAPLELSHRISYAGEAVVQLGGELDIASADAAVSYVTDIIDRYGGPVTADLSALAFCDARGLAALVRMAGHAEQADCPFRLASPNLSLVKIMRITGLHHRFLMTQSSGQVIPEEHPES